ncbi:hypothetical protein [Hydrogenovibrio thermophilus]|uniref:Uncharacterized protein n=1 Tax=Hydrogenovibrio thermophilus TaxID=265883 RepID=A0A451G4M7_9GAMM|nr:hypothetical protein [Hydrogenovibrio thermophilus]QAB14432.1 hypothetical protein EPV75_01465 [Hydrogenovibrio thermophilus]
MSESSIQVTCKDEIKAILDVIACMQNPEYENDYVEGEVSNSPENDKKIQALIAINSDRYSFGSLSRCPEISIQLPKRQDCFFAQNINDLLAKDFSQEKQPSCWYLQDKGLFFPDEVDQCGDQQVKNYLALIDLIDVLKSIADHTSTNSLIFLQGEKLEITIEYDVEDLTELSEVDEFKNHLSDKLHLEQRKAIFKKVLLDQLSRTQKKGRFKKLINQFDQIYDRYLENYKVYVSEFSVESVMDELHEKKIEFVSKFSDTLSNIQNQLLTIPVAVILIASQLQKTGLSLKNVAVLIAGLIFFGFMRMLVSNQRSILEYLHTELQHTREQFKKKYDDSLSNQLDKVFNDLECRYIKQKKLLKIVMKSIWFILVTVIIMFTIQSQDISLDSFIVWFTRLFDPCE